MARQHRIQPGDRVRYSSHLCRTIGAVTGWMLTAEARAIAARHRDVCGAEPSPEGVAEALRARGVA